MQRTLDVDEVVFDFSEVPTRRPRADRKRDDRIASRAERLFQVSQRASDERSAAILESLAGELWSYVGADVTLTAPILGVLGATDSLLSARGQVSLENVLRAIRVARRRIARRSIACVEHRTALRAIGRTLKRADADLTRTTRSVPGSVSRRQASNSGLVDLVRRLRRSLCVAPQAPPSLI